MRFLRLLLSTSAVLPVLVFVVVAYFRIRYPFELEWMEGGAVQHVGRVLDGKPLYTEPSLEWAPFLYTPLYYYASALLAKLMGLGFVPLRLLSTVSALATSFLVFWVIRRETRSALSGIVGGGLFISAFRICGSWFDIGRVDSLFSLFVVAVVAVLRSRDGVQSAVVAGLLTWLAFLTKQTAIVVLVPVGLALLLINRRRGLVFGAVAGGLISATVGIGHASSDGWFTYYTLVLPRQHEIMSDMYLGYWLKDLLTPAAVAMLFAGLFFWLVPSTDKRSARLFWGGLAVGTLLGSWGSRLHSGGWFNVLIPAYLGLALLFGLGFHSLLTRFGSGTTLSSSSTRHRVLVATVYLLATLQFVRLYYNPAQEIPSNSDLRAGEQLLAIMGRAPGEIFVPDHPYLAIRAGSPGTAHGIALEDILRADAGEIGVQLRRHLREEIPKREFVAVFLDNTRMVEYLGPGFKRAPDVLSDGAFWPVVGVRTRPSFLYVNEP